MQRLITRHQGVERSISRSRCVCCSSRHFGDDADFGAGARVEGKRPPHERHDAVLQAHSPFPATTIDKAPDQVINWVLDITGKALADERTRAN